MTQLVNLRWPQGEDLNIRLVYKEGADEKNARPVPLDKGFEARMDIVVFSTKEVLYTFLSADHPGSLTAGRNKEPNINILLPRSLTLPGGPLYETTGDLAYDLFLRNTLKDTQIKILGGGISIQRSHTLWA